MTVQDTTPSVTFVGTGAQTSFPFTFRADDVSWLTVDYLVNFDQFILNADQDNNPGGTVEYTVAPPLAQDIILTRDTSNNQELDYTRYDPFDSESHEDALDKLTMQIQDLQYLINNTLTQDFDLLGNVDFTGKVNGSMIYWNAGAMLWQDTGVELLFDPGVSFDTNVLMQVQAGADFTSALRMRSINQIEFFDATNITSSRIFQSVPDLIIDGQGVTGGVTFTGYSDVRPVWIATELALVTDIPVVISDHTLLTNIGVNTHAQIDTHIADSAIHFTEGSIDHTAISNVGINSHGIIDSHIANAAIHFTVGSIDHTVITNIGVNSHAQIDAAITLNAVNQVITDAHIADLNIHFGDAPADAQDYVRNNNAWAVASPGGVTDHFLLTNIGVNTHVQIDSHIADATIHFTEASIDHLNIGNIGVNSHVAIDAHIADGTIHLNEAALNVLYLRLDTTNDPLTGDLVLFGDLDVGPVGQRVFEVNNVVNGYSGITAYPDAYTRTVTGQSFFQWTSTLTSSIPGGGGIGNDTAPNFVNWAGEVILTEQGNLFNTQSLFAQGTTVTCQGANTGPIYTMINQPRLRTGSTGGSRTGSQQNAVRSQLSVGPNIAGNFALTSHEAFFATVFVNATVGAASIATVNYFAPKAPTLTAGGTIGTLNCMDIPNIPAAGITNLRGINSAMNSGFFINHTGTAVSNFGGQVNLTADFPNGVLRMGASNDYSQGWVATGEFYQQISTPAVTQWRWSAPSAGRLLMQGVGAILDELNINVNRFSMGAQSGTVGNQVGVFVAGARTTQVGGEWSDFLLTQAANLTVDDAMGGVFGWTINAPNMTLGTGSVTTAGALNIGGNVNQGSVNRFGVRILSNPSGGSGVNAALWVTAGATQLDGNIGFFGTTAIPQETAVPVSAAGIHAALVNYGLIT